MTSELETLLDDMRMNYLARSEMAEMLARLAVGTSGMYSAEGHSIAFARIDTIAASLEVATPTAEVDFIGIEAVTAHQLAGRLAAYTNGNEQTRLAALRLVTESARELGARPKMYACPNNPGYLGLFTLTNGMDDPTEYPP